MSFLCLCPHASKETKRAVKTAAQRQWSGVGVGVGTWFQERPSPQSWFPLVSTREVGKEGPVDSLNTRVGSRALTNKVMMMVKVGRGVWVSVMPIILGRQQLGVVHVLPVERTLPCGLVPAVLQESSVLGLTFHVLSGMSFPCLCFSGRTVQIALWSPRGTQPLHPTCSFHSCALAPL